MRLGLRRIRQSILVASICALSLLPPREAAAVLVFSHSPYLGWVIICTDGLSIELPTTVLPTDADAILFGVNFCAGHGGVAAITDGSVSAALATIQTCDNASSIVLAKDLGQGNYEAMSAGELAARLAQGNGNPVALTGYRLMSVNIAGTELIPNAPTNLARIPIGHVFSDENGDGQYVGGPTLDEECAAAVPLHPAVAPLLGLLMAALGAMSLGWRRRVTVGA